jgi:hypothetical protein
LPAVLSEAAVLPVTISLSLEAASNAVVSEVAASTLIRKLISREKERERKYSYFKLSGSTVELSPSFVVSLFSTAIPTLEGIRLG